MSLCKIFCKLVATPDCFQISTCQRTLFLTALTPQIKKTFSEARRLFIGAEAYEFLLRFSSGLESEIKGETDVFGQVKTAYRNLSLDNPALADFLQHVFQKLFEDTKEIRAHYLQGIGGNTYGALARRLMNPTANDQVLVIGAGDISKSVSPYFADSHLTIWNRSNGRLLELHHEFSKKGLSAEFSAEQGLLPQAIENATLVIIATPFGSAVESTVAQHISKSTRVLHLGAQSNETAQLPFASLCLTDLFEMEKEQSQLREKQVKQAMQACHERALLRGLARSIHIAHGWEDLAVFI